jgi:hypothetical protein
MKLKLAAAILLSAAVVVPVLVTALPRGGFEGKPAFKAASATGAFVWEDEKGLHVRVTSVRGPVRFQGEVCAGSRLHSVGTVILEEGDSIAIARDARCLEFGFLNHRGIDGFNFKTESAQIEFDFSLDDEDLPPSQIWIGRDGLHPEDSVFVLERDVGRPARSSRGSR